MDCKDQNLLSCCISKYKQNWWVQHFEPAGCVIVSKVLLP